MKHVWFLTFFFFSFFLGLIGGVKAVRHNNFGTPQPSLCMWVNGVWTCSGSSQARGINFPSASPSPLPTLPPVPTPSPSPDPNECDVACIILIIVCVLIAILVALFIWQLRKARRKTEFLEMNDFDQEAQNQEKLVAEKAAAAQAVEAEPPKKEVEKEVEPEPEEEDDNSSDADGSTVAVDSVDANLSEEDELYREGREALSAPDTGSLTPRRYPKADLDLDQEIHLGEEEEEIVSPRRRTIGSLEVSSNSLRDYRTSMKGD